MPDPNRFKNISKILSAVSRSSSFFATAHFTAAPSRLLSIAVQTCLSSFKLSCSRCSLMTSTHVSMHPSETSLNSFGFLKVFLDLPPHLSLESVFLVANASNILFIISQVLAHVMASGPTFLFVVDSPWTTRRICCSTLHNCLAPSPPPVLCLLHPGLTVTVLTPVCSVVVPRNRLCCLVLVLLPDCLVLESFSR